MCLDFSDRESILQEAREAAETAIRSAAWMRIKAELDIMERTLEMVDSPNGHHDFREIANEFVKDIERGCFHE